MYGRLCGKVKELKIIEEFEKYEIKNPILKTALFGGYVCDKHIGGRIDDNNNPAHSFLTYLIKRLFSIHRLPGFEEGYRFHESHQKRMSFGCLSEQELDSALDELRRMYKFTQSYLSIRKDVVNGKIKLSRFLRRYEIEQIVDQLTRKDPIIRYHTNILTSYTTVTNDWWFGLPIRLIREVNTEDILIMDECCKYPRFSCDAGEKEVHVINRSPFGRAEFPLVNFTWQKELLEVEERGNMFPEYQIDYNNPSSEFGHIDRYGKKCDHWAVRRLISLIAFVNKYIPSL